MSEMVGQTPHVGVNIWWILWPGSTQLLEMLIAKAELLIDETAPSPGEVSEIYEALARLIIK